MRLSAALAGEHAARDAFELCDRAALDLIPSATQRLEGDAERRRPPSRRRAADDTRLLREHNSLAVAPRR